MQSTPGTQPEGTTVLCHPAITLPSLHHPASPCHPCITLHHPAILMIVLLQLPHWIVLFVLQNTKLYLLLMSLLLGLCLQNSFTVSNYKAGHQAEAAKKNADDVAAVADEGRSDDELSESGYSVPGVEDDEIDAADGLVDVAEGEATDDVEVLGHAGVDKGGEDCAE